MKNFFKALGKAVVYLLVFCAIQIALLNIFTIVLTINTVISAPTLVAEDSFRFIALITEEVYANYSLVSIISGVLSLVVYWLIFVARKKELLKEVNAVMPKGGRLMLMMIPAGVLIQISVSSVLNMLPASLTDSYSSAFNLTRQGHILWEIIAAVLIAPICEEVAVRGLVYSRLKKGMPRWTAIILQALLFGLLHGQALWISYAFLFGICFALVHYAFDSLLPTILLHAAINASSYLLGFLPDFPGALAVYFAVCTISSVVLMVYVFKKLKKIPAKNDIGNVPLQSE